MKLYHIATLTLLAGVFASPTADAGLFGNKDKDKTEESADDGAAEAVEIADTGIAAFDDVFGEVRTIHETLDRASQQLADANSGIATALGLSADTPLATALADLKDKAAGNIEVAMDGGKPSLKASDAVPENVQAGIDAVNAAVTNVTATVGDLAALPDQVKGLVEKSKAMPAQLKDPAIISGVPKGDLLKIPKTLKNNTKALTSTPDKVTSVTSEMTGFVDAVKNFNGE